MLVATDGCEIYEVLDSDGTNLHRGPMVQGHFGHGVRGLAVHPTNPDQFASAGADRTVRVWNRADRKMVSPALDENALVPGYSLLAFVSIPAVYSTSCAKRLANRIIIRPSFEYGCGQHGCTKKCGRPHGEVLCVLVVYRAG